MKHFPFRALKYNYYNSSQQMDPFVLVLQYHYIDHQLIRVLISLLTSPSSGSTASCTKGLTSKLVRVVGGSTYNTPVH